MKNDKDSRKIEKDNLSAIVVIVLIGMAVGAAIKQFLSLI